MRLLISLVSCLVLAGCTGYPKTVTPVKEFDLKRYAGRWYEIARLDHSFERGMEQVTADYTILEDGSVEVVNRGFSREESKWKEAVGRAAFARSQDEGYLTVSFWGPFYSSYVVFDLDRQNYRYAFVSGPNASYLWLLARTPEVDPKTLALFVETAEEKGFKTEDLIFVNH